MHEQTSCKSMRNEGIPADNRGGSGCNGHFHYAIALVGDRFTGDFDVFDEHHGVPLGHSMIVVGIDQIAL
ncbi:hypothetical protein [Pseudomonas sp. SID14000]|uniref:hypothetical protein n=1 Tax=Pseudomonas sp. SID14000 TaxID=1986221 RepID=UPI001482908A|nr:hypothetical protein [Pseudomonas sp. SID14000]